MLLNSRALALLLALSISIITTSFLSLVPDITVLSLVVTALLSFSSAYLLIFSILEFLFFKEIREIYGAFEKLKEKDYSLSQSDINKKSANPFKEVNRELLSYAEVKQQEIEELKKIEAFRREFLADVSHELKTPIFAAQGFVHTLLDGAVKDKSVRMKFLKKAAKSLDGLDALVHDLLTISQMESGVIKMHKSNFNIIELIEEVFDQFETKAEKKEIELKLNLPPEQPVLVYADRQRIYQVMLNLISNAIKYTKEESIVEVDIKEEKSDISIFVKDNGRGIPPEDINRIFERFYRVEKSRSKEKGGTGLGLAIVKHILEGHGSKVSVTSTVKKGSVFSFKLKKAKNVDVIQEKNI
ncbi:MAG: ATP-binding protein [Cyclobacteriaceae bacterium]